MLYDKGMSFIDNLRDVLSGSRGGRLTVDGNAGPVVRDNAGGIGSEEWWSRTRLPGISDGKKAIIDFLDEQAMVDTNDAYPLYMHADGDYQHDGIPEGWTMQVYSVLHQGTDENGEPYGYANVDDTIKIYKDENGKVKGVETPIQSFETSDENEINEKIKQFLGEDGVLKLEKVWGNQRLRRI